MVSINKWFFKNAKIPLLVLGVATIVIQLGFIGYILWGSIRNQTKSVENLVTIANLALEQKNRPVLESTFSVAIEELGAEKILLCEGNETQLTLPYGLMNCSNLPKPGIFTRVEKIEAIGRPEYSFYFYLPLLDIPGSYLALLALTILFFIFTMATILKVQKRFAEDVLTPLENNLLEDSPINILQLDQLRKKIKEIQKIKEREAAANAMFEHKRKVAHNIRSLVQTMRSLQVSIQDKLSPRRKELFSDVVEGISGILTDLNNKTSNHEARNAFATEESFFNHLKEVNQKSSKTEIEDVVKSVVDQKRMEIKIKEQSVRINCTIDPSINYSFVDVVELELRSIISNLLNNAIEAPGDGIRKIKISVSKVDSKIQIEVTDNGYGVPESIRASIFERGITHGKANGTGYGLFHAKMFLESWGGSIELTEKDSSETSFLITIPCWSPAPLKITDGDTIVILDDDNFIHDTWKDKFQAWSEQTGSKIALKNFVNPKKFVDWISNEDIEYARTTFLIDNDLGSNFEQGSNLIKSLGIEELSLLVTNRYDDKELVSYCSESRIELLPKPCIFSMSFTEGFGKV